jgi:hypothetical protein
MANQLAVWTCLQVYAGEKLCFRAIITLHRDRRHFKYVLFYNNRSKCNGTLTCVACTNRVAESFLSRVLNDSDENSLQGFHTRMFLPQAVFAAP